MTGSDSADDSADNLKLVIKTVRHYWALLKTPTTYPSLTKHIGHPMLMSPGKMVVDRDTEEVVAGLSIDIGTSKETWMLDRTTMQQREQSNQVSANISVPGPSVATPNAEMESLSNQAGSAKIQATGVRRVWGTMKSCTPTAVKGTIVRLISNELVPGIDSITVKRKYRRTSNNKLCWWFLLSCLKKPYRH